MHEVQDCLVCPIKLLKNIVSCVPLHLADDVEHFRDRKLMFRKYSLSGIGKDTVTVLTLIALSTLSCHFLPDRVCTLAVRTRHLVRPPVIAQILQTVLFVRQKNLGDALSTDHVVVDYELQS
jgi:hypothetical protein